MPNFEDFIRNYHIIFHTDPPVWLLAPVGCVLGLWVILTILGKIKDTWTQNFQPLFYQPDEKRRSEDRRFFAEFIEHNIDVLNDQDGWNDYRFAELEAEVEAEGRRKTFSIIPFLNPTRSGLRREKSLSKALMPSVEPIILLEGEPGSGKSVALRHVAQKMAAHAKKMRSTKSIIPIYVNLKLLKRENGEKIDRDLIESFVRKSLQRNDRKIGKFLDDEFDIGIQNGAWFFLFDSFDELPEVLSSTEVDNKIKDYRQAIDDFLHGMGQCRGVVASRPYHGPVGFGWPRFRVLPLTQTRQLELIRNANFKPKMEQEIIGHLGNALQAIRSMASNPFYLTLLYKHMENGHPFPENPHSIFATYIQSEFTRNEKYLQHLFQLDADQVRTAAENIAFCMTASPGLGLNPTRASLRNAMIDLGISIDSTFETILDALEYMKLARPDVATNAPLSRSFTFAHRRYQEYFATCTVLREPSRVSPNQLLTDARWRETTVVMCQTQPKEALAPTLSTVDQLLIQYINTIPDHFLVPISSNSPDQINTPVEAVLSKGQSTIDDQPQPSSKSFPWPSGLLHVLGLLQDGFANHLDDIPAHIRQYIAKLIVSATERGILLDKKWALEVASTVPDSTLVNLLKQAFSNKSQWLKEVAYRQVAHLSNIPSDIAQGIRDALVELAASKRLKKEKYATQAHLRRIPQPANFLWTMQLLLRIPGIDIGLQTISLTLYYSGLIGASIKSGWKSPNWQFEIFTIFIVFILIVIPSITLRIFMGPLHSSRNNRLIIASITIRLCSYCLVILLVGFLLGFLDWHWNGVPSGWIIIYAAFFGPLAFRAAQTGNFVRPRLWAFLPIWPLLYAIAHPYCLIKPLQNRLGHLIGYFIMILAISTCAIVDTLLVQIKHNNIIDILLWLQTGLVLVGIPCGLIFILYPVSWAYNRIHDRLQWHIWLRNHAGQINHQELCEIVSAYHLMSYRVKILKVIRQQRLLRMTSETEAFLIQIAIDIEAIQQISKHKKDRKALKSYLSSSTNFNFLNGYDKLVSQANSAILDEFSKLLEDMRVSVANVLF